MITIHLTPDEIKLAIFYAARMKGGLVEGVRGINITWRLDNENQLISADVNCEYAEFMEITPAGVDTPEWDYTEEK